MIRSANGFDLRINFNLKGHHGDRSEIMLTTTILGERVRIFTGLLIEPNYWQNAPRNEVGGMAIVSNTMSRQTRNNSVEINNRLQEIIRFGNEYCDLVARQDLLSEEIRIEHNAKNFKQFMVSKIRGEEAEVRKTPISFVENYIIEKSERINRRTGQLISRGTLYNHKNALARLKEYFKDNRITPDWRIFDKRFEENFTKWMLRKNYSPNTISCQFSIMKIWCHEAVIEQLLKDYSFQKWHTTKYESENIYLTESEIDKIYNLDLSKFDISNQSHIEETRDLFIIACWTGLRYGDWANLAECAITEEGMTVRCDKTQINVFIPFLDESVKEIIRRYDKKLPKPVDRAHINKQLQRLGEWAEINTMELSTKVHGGHSETTLIPRYMRISTHTARRSFCTNMYLRGKNVIDIMAVSGHSTEENFLRYIKISKKDRAKRLAQ